MRIAHGELSHGSTVRERYYWVETTAFGSPYQLRATVEDLMTGKQGKIVERSYEFSEEYTPGDWRLFVFAPQQGDDREYNVRQGHNGTSCTCKAGQHGRDCVHKIIVADLVRRGSLPKPQRPAEPDYRDSGSSSGEYAEELFADEFGV